MLLGNSLRQTVHTYRASVHQEAKLAAALLRVARVTVGVVESLLPGLWLMLPAGWLPRTGISSGTLRSVIEYKLPFYLWQLIVTAVDWCSLSVLQRACGSCMTGQCLLVSHQVCWIIISSQVCCLSAVQETSWTNQSSHSHLCLDRLPWATTPGVMARQTVSLVLRYLWAFVSDWLRWLVYIALCRAVCQPSVTVEIVSCDLVGVTWGVSASRLEHTWMWD